MLISWSGGLDSSLLLAYALRFWYDKSVQWTWYQNTNKLIKYKRKHKAPRVLIVESRQLGKAKQLMESKARRKIRKFLKYKFDDVFVKLDPNPGYNGDGLPQPMMWLSQAAMLIDDGEPFVVGWLRSDHDVCRRINVIKDVWSGLCRLADKKCPLWTPLINNTKAEVIEECRKYNILDLCWWCECPIKDGRSYKACGTCGPCLNMITSEVRNHRKYVDKKLDYDEYINWLLDGEFAVAEDRQVGVEAGGDVVQIMSRS